MSGRVIKKAKQLEDQIRQLCQDYTDQTGLLVEQLNISRNQFTERYQVSMLASLEPEPSFELPEDNRLIH